MSCSSAKEGREWVGGVGVKSLALKGNFVHSYYFEGCRK